MSHKKNQLSVGDLHKQNICMSHKKDQLSVGDLHKQNMCLTKKISYVNIINKPNVSQKRSVICW